MPRLTTKLFDYGIRLLVITIIAAFSALTTLAQGGGFSSGSTGADGAFAPTANQALQVPESGVFNFTTVNIPSGVTVSFTPNARNTSVTILASGNVTIAGSIIIDGQAGSTATYVGAAAGPGGFRGGTGGFTASPFLGLRGEGRGGGEGGRASYNGGGGGGYATIGQNGGGASFGAGGPQYGSSTLLPLIGGSGGGGGGGTNDGSVGESRGGAGGGGGGAILIASSGSITLSGAVSARGGTGGASGTAGGGGGSGGGVRLIANTITGSGSLDVRGGDGGTIWYSGNNGGAGSNGYLRVEAYEHTSFTPNSNSVTVSRALPNPIITPNNPQLRIASVAGVNAPTAPRGSLEGQPDVVLPSTQTNPVSVAIEASNIATGTVVQVTLTPPTGGSRTIYQSTALSGTTASSTATASVTLPAGMCVIDASITIDLTTARMNPIFIDGERVNRIEVAASFGGTSQSFYVTSSGRRIAMR